MKFSFNQYPKLEGLHAFLGASKYHWLNYDEQKLVDSYANHLAKAKGTRLHEIASDLINEGIKLPKTKQTLNMFVNDAIGYRMKSEQVLFYSENCFGTADAISFRKGLLRIHDLKTGVTPAKMEQLLIYAALFCLEYKYRPGEIKFELRIYQNNEVLVFEPTAEDVAPVMDLIKHFDKILKKIQEEEEE